MFIERMYMFNDILNNRRMSLIAHFCLVVGLPFMDQGP